ncbi:MAG: transglycosylase SLT domain-containing protein [Alphaproteobacteria bacterium]
MPFHSGLETALARACAIICLLAMGLGGGSKAMAYVPDAEKKICSETISRHERAERIPGQLLSAVSLAESGRWDKANRAHFAWPWTVTAGGKGRFFATKAKAIATVRHLQRRGVRNIDVGCMQINLMYHNTAFATLEEAFDPDMNVAYAARLLRRLNDARRSWIMAVGLYHSSSRARHYRYRRKVLKFWNLERRRAAKERREAWIREYKRRQEERLRLHHRRTPGQLSQNRAAR